MNGWKPWLLGAALAVGLLVLAAQRDFGPSGYGLPFKGAAIVLLGLLPTLWEARRVGARRFPFLALLGAIYGLFFGLPLLVSDRVVFMSLEPGVEALQGAADLSLLGLLAIYGGYALAAHLPLGRPLILAVEPRRGLALAVGSVVVGFGARLVLRQDLAPPGWEQPLSLMGQGVLLGLGLALVLARTGRIASLWAPLALGVVFPLHVLLELSSGSLGYAVRDGAFVLLLLWCTGAKVPILLIALGGLFAMGLRGAANEYRVVLHHSPHLLEQSSLSRGAAFFELAFAEYEREGPAAISAAALGRFSQIALFAEVVDRTPLAIPHWHGETYASLPATFVPRVLWPDKPSKDLGQRFGHRYGVLHATDTTTSVNLPQLVEHYVNFGAPGVLLGSALLGLLYRALLRRLVHRSTGELGWVLAALFASRLLHVESDVSLVLGGAAQLAVVCVPLALWAAPRGVPREARGELWLAERTP